MCRWQAALPRAAACRLLTIYTLPASNRNMLKNNGAARGQRRVPDDHPIVILQSSSLPSLVQREIAQRILAGELAAGAKLNEVDIATRLGVSRGPVREAFRALEESGLVRFEKNRGVFVRSIGLEEADQIYELRALLDEFAGRRAAQNARPADVRDLRSLIERMERAVERKDVDEYFALNLAFHERIVELSGNAKLAQLYRRLVNELNLYRRASLNRAGTLSISIAEHRAIVDRIGAGQASAAGRLLRNHVMSSRDRAHGSNTPVRTAPPARRDARRAR
jgi:phosphonate utilization transcriptional regulator